MDYPRGSQRPTCSVWSLLLCLALASYQGQTSAYSVSAVYSLYVCPEGQNVNLTCTIKGALADKHDHLLIFWHYSRAKDPHCEERKPIRNMTQHHGGHTGHVLTNGMFHLTLSNLSQVDSGGYCCNALESNKKHHVHRALGYIELQVKTDDPALQSCTYHSSEGADDGNTTAAALAIVSCIIGILCLPLILILVYKQRKAISHRRAQELVRMDSEAQGIENPVFDEPPITNFEQRSRLNFMAIRQPSESGHHLLSEPNTPLSPPGPNDCFFPSLEPVPDSPDPVPT
ncbi:V-type immunoglobulin domain-containing suppressor of T-cell activation [Discoglossus pictus]